MPEIISVAGIVVAAAVALAVAHLHRKQLRQLEVYRQNPEAGLKPSLHPITAFLKHFGVDIALLFLCPLFVLVLQATSHEPISRFDVFMIAISIVMLILGLILLVARLA